METNQESNPDPDAPGEADLLALEGREYLPLFASWYGVGRITFGQLRCLLQTAAENAESDGDDRGLPDLIQIGGHHRIPLIIYWDNKGFISPNQLRYLLAQHWTHAGQTSAIGIPRLVALFRTAGFVTDRSGVEPPTNTLTVYRGIRASGRRRGVSWTLDRERACWFARWYSSPTSPPGILCTAEIPPEHVLGIFRGRGEAEVVVDPKRLRRVREEVVLGYLLDGPMLLTSLIEDPLSPEP